MFEALGQPFRDLNFRRLLIFLGTLFFAVNLSGPFYAVYMIKRLELSMALVIGLQVSQPDHERNVLPHLGKGCRQFQQ